jgi:hypothetical protein
LETLADPAFSIEPDEIDQRIIAFVRDYRKVHEKGPLWREVSEAVDIPIRIEGRYSYTFPNRLIRLRRGKWLRFSKKTRSLNIGSAAK